MNNTTQRQAMKLKFTHQPAMPANMTPVKTAKKINWGRWIYLAILAIALVSFSVWLFNRLFYYHAVGQLRRQSVVVNFPYDVRVLQYLVKEGDSIRQGQPLFRYTRDFRQASNDLAYREVTMDHADARERLNIIRTIEQKKAERSALLAQQRIYQQEREAQQLKVYLDVAPATSVDDASRQAAMLGTKAAALVAEIKALESYAAQLSGLQKQTTAAVAAQAANADSTTETYYAPVHGRLDRLHTPAQEVAYRSNEVTSILQQDQYIQAYLEQDDLLHFSENDRVELLFPGNIKSGGVIVRIYEELAKTPAELRLTERPAARKLVAEIRPCGGANWPAQNILSVEISRKRSLFF